MTALEYGNPSAAQSTVGYLLTTRALFWEAGTGLPAPIPATDSRESDECLIAVSLQAGFLALAHLQKTGEKGSGGERRITND